MNGHGGKRPGAGRPKGAASRANDEVRQEAAATGELPLAYMLRIMRDPSQPVARYIDPNPGGWEVRKFTYENPWTREAIEQDRVFIPSKLRDNKFLGPEYVANLQMVGSDRTPQPKCGPTNAGLIRRQ